MIITKKNFFCWKVHFNHHLFALLSRCCQHWFAISYKNRPINHVFNQPLLINSSKSSNSPWGTDCALRADWGINSGPVCGRAVICQVGAKLRSNELFLFFADIIYLSSSQSNSSFKSVHKFSTQPYESQMDPFDEKDEIENGPHGGLFDNVAQITTKQ